MGGAFAPAPLWVSCTPHIMRRGRTYPTKLFFAAEWPFSLPLSVFFLGFGRPQEKSAGDEGIVPIAARAI